jgi:hypothetical protein
MVAGDDERARSARHDSGVVDAQARQRVVCRQLGSSDIIWILYGHGKDVDM